MSKLRYLPFIFMLFAGSALAGPKEDIIKHWEHLPNDSARQHYIYSVFLNYLNTGQLKSCLKNECQTNKE